MAWALPANSDLVIQLHLMPGDAAAEVQASVGFFFTNEPPARKPLMLRLGRQNIDIAAGRSDYTIEDRYLLPVDVDVYGVQPHAHYRARRVEGFAVRPDGTRVPLIRIEDWDFNWQDAYRYRAPVPLPRGTTLQMRYTYDNSAANRRNPDREPKRVRWGQRSSDEMGDLWIQVLPRSDGDRTKLAADFGPKVLAEDAVGYETLLAGEPANGRLHEAAAAIYLSLDRVDAALSHLREALRLSPESVEAHYNMGTSLIRLRRPAEARQHLERALSLQPSHVASRVNLGVVLRSEQRFDEAAAHLRRAIELEPGSAAAHTNLAAILAGQQRSAEAVSHYRRALEINPDLLEALTDLSWIFATDPRADLRDPSTASRLAEHAVALTAARDVRALDTLGAALAAAGDFARAAETVETAIGLAAAQGSEETVRQLREHLELYRARRPLRQ
jgi:tetratricopeptide (TPR) repeat protein